MPESDRCELHEVAIFSGERGTEDLLRLARSPIGDECQLCPVCRSAREYVELRLVERSGQEPPPGMSTDAAWKKLQAAVESAKTSMHRSR